MGRIVASMFSTLDGVVESPDQWHFPYFDEEMGRAVDAHTDRCSAYLMGRVLYQEWAAYWPGNTTDGFGAFINPLPKHVLSSTLREEDLTWEGASLVPNDDAARRVAELKAAEEGDIGMSGCATTVRWLLSQGLLDELHLLVDPIAVGSGRRLFDGADRTPLRLLSSRALPTGVLDLRYAPADRAAHPAP